VHPGDVLAYPDLKVGIPSLLLCIEMAIFSVMHLFTFPYQPYKPGAKTTFYPVPDAASDMAPRPNEHVPKQGGFLGVKAFWDAANIWDIIKAFGRGARWLFVGRKRRHEDVSYQTKPGHGSIDDTYQMTGRNGEYGGDSLRRKSTDHLPVADQYRSSTYGMHGDGGQGDVGHGGVLGERENLIDHHHQQAPGSRQPGRNPYEQPESNPYENTPYDPHARVRGNNTARGNNSNVPPGFAR
jgi:hypothetical protein